MTSDQPAEKRLYLIDSSIYIFRAWFILPSSITNSEGDAVNALYGFADFLAQVLEQTSATYIVCAFDQSLGSSARNAIYPPYKANRDPAPLELKKQFAWCQALCDQIGIAQFARAEYEADDIIGTLAATASKADFRTTILSADKDLAQFIGEHDEYWNFAKKERLDARGIEKRFGINASQIADMLALCGDKVDNIPGIPGVGQATAARLLKKWGNLERLFENREAVADMKFRGSARVAQLLSEHEDTVRLARQLTGLLPVDDLPTKPSMLKRQRVKRPELEKFLKERGFGDTRTRRLLTTFCKQE